MKSLLVNNDKQQVGLCDEIIVLNDDRHDYKL